MHPENRAAGKHPPGLRLLFAVEMWERFSYYGMRALLMLYMVKSLSFSTERAGAVYGWYTGLVYLGPVAGGYIADRFLGARNSLVAGGVVIAAGHFSMALGGPGPLFAAMALIVLGTSLFKPSIAAVLGGLYDRDDPKRDSGFILFYMGINIGAFLAPLVCGALGEGYGWHYGFSAAGIGMTAGLTLYLLKRGECIPGDVGKAVRSADLERGAFGAEGARNLAALGILAFFCMFFFAAFEQAGSSLTLFADRSVDRRLFGFEIPASYFQSINPLLVILLAPVVATTWRRLEERLARRNRALRDGEKFGFAMVFAAAGCALAAVAAGLAKGEGASPLWLVAVYLLFTIGELSIAPVSLSMVTGLAPKGYTSFFLGLWFLSIFGANLAGGKVAGLYDSVEPQVFFLWVGGAVLCAGITLLLASGRIARMSGTSGWAKGPAEQPSAGVGG